MDDFHGKLTYFLFCFKDPQSIERGISIYYPAHFITYFL